MTSSISGNLDDAQDRAGNAAQNVRDAASDFAQRAGRAGEAVKKQVRSSGAQLYAAGDDILDASRSAASTVSSQIKEQPLLAAAVALGVGYMLALLMRGSRR